MSYARKPRWWQLSRVNLTETEERGDTCYRLDLRSVTTRHPKRSRLPNWHVLRSHPLPRHDNGGSQGGIYA